jgi:hypothetical protein
MLADWMKHHSQSGLAHTDKNLALSQKTEAMKNQGSLVSVSAQSARPQSKAVNKTGPAKDASSETVQSRNVLVP